MDRNQNNREHVYPARKLRVGPRNRSFDITVATPLNVKTANPPISKHAVPARTYKNIDGITKPAQSKHVAPVDSPKKAVPIEAKQPVQSHVEQVAENEASVAPIKKVRSLRFIIVRGTAFAVLAIGLGLMVQGYSLNSTVDTQVKALEKTKESASSSEALPAESKPQDNNYLEKYTVAADLPRIITIPSINVNARVMQVSMDNEGRVGVPKNGYDTAWYMGSARPGEAGATLIDGHVSTTAGSAVFGKIKKLVAGDKIQIETGDRRKLSYTVTSVETVDSDKVDMSSLITSTGNKHVLNLITCGGQYNPREGEFNKRTIVRSIAE
jgi:sortase (surface protein transpeptidase)